MKALLLSLVLSLGLIGSASASVPVAAVWVLHNTALFAAGADDFSDPRLFKTVLAHRTGAPGYNFEITQFEFDQAPGKYVIVK